MNFLIFVLAALVAVASANDYEEICGERTGYFFVRDPKSCRGYFLCKEGEAYQDNCPHGMFFDESRILCDHEANVRCTLPPPAPEPIGCPPYGIAQIPIPGKCKEYTFCDYGKETVLPCANGTIFDENYRICMDEKSAQCNECPLEDTVLTFIPERRDCRKYYLCKNRNKLSIFCAKYVFSKCLDGRHFDFSLSFRKLYFDEKDGTCKLACGTGAYKCPVSFKIYSMNNPILTKLFLFTV